MPTAFQNYADVFKKLGYPVALNFRSIFSTDGGDLRLLPSTIGEKKPEQQWIGIAPFAAHPQKVYPIDQMEQVVTMLIGKYPSCRVFFFGKGENEEQPINSIVSRYPQCINASGILRTLEEELILMSHLDVMLSMDSANMHLASLTATPVVSIWGATHPFAGFMGWNQSLDNIVQTDIACRPCSIFGNKPCYRGDMACMKNLSPELIFNKVEQVLNKK